MRLAAYGMVLALLCPFAAQASLPAQVMMAGALVPSHKRHVEKVVVAPQPPRFFSLPQNSATMMPHRPASPPPQVFPAAEALPEEVPGMRAARNGLSEENAKLLLSIFNSPN